MIIDAIILGVFGFLMANVLTASGEIFAFIPRFVSFVTFAPKQVKKWTLFHYWIARITYGCGKCIAGFWSIIYCFFYENTMQVDDVFKFVVVAIFTAYFLSRKLN